MKSECEAVDRELIAIAFLLVFISDQRGEDRKAQDCNPFYIG